MELARIVIDEDYSHSGGRPVHDLATFALGAVLQLLLDRSAGRLFRGLT